MAVTYEKRGRGKAGSSKRGREVMPFRAVAVVVFIFFFWSVDGVACSGVKDGVLLGRAFP